MRKMRNSQFSSIAAVGVFFFSTSAMCHDVDGVLPPPEMDSAHFSPECDLSSVSCITPVERWELTSTSPSGGSEIPAALANSNLATAPEETSYNVVDETSQPDGVDKNLQAGPQIQRPWTYHTPKENTEFRGFWKQTKSIKTEVLVFVGYFSLQSGKKLFRENTDFHFHNEGWFGKDTTNLGMDKVLHAYDTYLLAEFLHSRIHKNTGAAEGDAVTAAVLASGLMALNELSDGIEVDSGYSMQDIVMNVAGASFSVLRNTVPGLKEKVSFKLEIVPNSNIYSYRGQRHYEQERFMFSLKGSGFEGLQKTPMRYLDLQVGYYASDFMAEDRIKGKEPKRHLFVGVGLNLGEIFFGESRSKVGRSAYTVLDYFQVPYTSVRYDTTGHFGFSTL